MQLALTASNCVLQTQQKVVTDENEANTGATQFVASSTNSSGQLAFKMVGFSDAGLAAGARADPIKQATFHSRQA
jgi:hypothetical protein